MGHVSARGWRWPCAHGHRSGATRLLVGSDAIGWSKASGEIWLERAGVWFGATRHALRRRAIGWGRPRVALWFAVAGENVDETLTGDIFAVRCPFWSVLAGLASS